MGAHSPWSSRTGLSGPKFWVEQGQLQRQLQLPKRAQRFHRALAPGEGTPPKVQVQSGAQSSPQELVLQPDGTRTLCLANQQLAGGW